METQVERIRALCKMKGTPVSKLEKDLGYGNGFLNPKKIKSVPANRLYEIADYLEVTPDYIVRGEDVYAKSANDEKTATPEGDGYTDAQLAIMEAAKHMTNSEAEQALAVLKALKAGRTNQDS